MSKLSLGWEEWLSLPDLGLPALKAKVDTGARTSALHAFNIEPFGTAEKRRVRFGIHPVPDKPEIEVYCSARVVDRREVTSSNGETETRYVIETKMQVGGTEWPVQITLTDRGSMSYRMLLGRQALETCPIEIAVNPSASFMQPELSYDVYEKLAKKSTQKRSLRVAILTREPNSYSTQKLVAAGEARDHVVELIDTTRCYMHINATSPEVHYDGKALPHFDAVIPRIGASITSYGLSVVRQFETVGAYCVNRSSGIAASRDKLFAHQLLASEGIGMPATAFASSPKDSTNLIKLVGEAPVIIKLLESTQGRGVVLTETKKAAESVISAFRGLRADFLVQEFVKEAEGADIRCLVLGGKVVGSIMRKAAEGEFRSNLHQGGSAKSVRITKQEREIAIRAARIMGLEFAGVDMLRSHEGPKVLEVNSSPGLQGIEKATRKDIATMVFEQIEKRARPVIRRKRRSRKKA
ncbi:MAG: 30S ribosomal protein S6--L-glutamate ligase [bacterium]